MDIAAVFKWSCGTGRLPKGASKSPSTLFGSILILICIGFSSNSMALSATEPNLGQSYIDYQLIDEQGQQLSTQAQRLISQPVSTEVDMQVTGWVNRARVKQVFVNSSEYWMKGVYRFPLPHDAAIDTLLMRVGDRKMVGVIKPKEQAKALFKQAQKQGKTATITLQERPNIFTNGFTNLAPGQKLEIELVYQQKLNQHNGKFGLRFPTAITPRYAAKVSQNPLPDNQPSQLSNNSGSQLEQQSALIANGNIHINILLDGLADVNSIASPYHDISIEPDTKGRFAISLTDVNQANRDFALRWQTADSIQPSAVVYAQSGRTHRPHSIADKSIDDKQYGLVMVSPAKLEQQQLINRELILVVDTSGSMHGASIEQAKAALITALATLRAKDRFNIIAFDSTTRSFAPYAVNVTAKTLGKAQQFIRHLHADGGTEMVPALNQALHIGAETDSHLLRQVIFITDGAVNNEQALFNQITAQLGNSRLFTVGIGAAPNGYFMERAARVGRGSYTYIGDIGEVEQSMRTLLNQIAMPRLTDIQVRSKSGLPMDVWPQHHGDIYQGQSLMFSYRKPLAADAIVVSGFNDGQYWQTELEPQIADTMTGLDIVWAREKIAGLMLSRNADNREQIKHQITELAINHHLVSRYTSLIAIDDIASRTQGQALMQGQTAQNLPQGWQVGQLPQTASFSPLALFLGCLLLLLSTALMLSYRHLFNRSLGNVTQGAGDTAEKC